MAHDHVQGAVTIQSDKPNAFDENDITILENIVDGLAIALENDRLYHETRKSLEEIRMLNRDYLQRAWAETLETYGELAYDFENPNAAVETQARKTETVELPLLLRDEVIGTITLEVDRPALTAEETSFVENVTTQAAIALENARLLHDTERRAIQEQKLNELAAGFSRALTIDELIRSAAQELGQLPTVAEVSVQLSPAGQTAPLSSPPGLKRNGNGKEHSA
jgi:GAF domain-containing protein